MRGLQFTCVFCYFVDADALHDSLAADTAIFRLDSLIRVRGL